MKLAAPDSLLYISEMIYRTSSIVLAFVIIAGAPACKLADQNEAMELTDPRANPVTYFEIPVTDMDRAVRFYEAVFLTSLERETIDGNSMALFPYAENGEGITGALAMGDSYVPSDQGVRIYFNAKDISATLNRVSLAGGKVVYPRTSIGDLGWVAEFQDSEGNVVALHAPTK